MKSHVLRVVLLVLAGLTLPTGCSGTSGVGLGNGDGGSTGGGYDGAGGASGGGSGGGSSGGASGSGSGGNGSSSGGGSGGSSGSGGGSGGAAREAAVMGLPAYSRTALASAGRPCRTSDGALGFETLYDHQLGVACTALTATDGQLRCLPYDGAFVQSFYADSGCTTPVAYSAYGLCPAPQPAYAVHYDASLQETAYPVTGTFTGTAYVGDPASCTLVTPTEARTFYTIGAAIDPSAFEAVTIGVASPSPSDLAQSGSRLVVQGLTSADGASGAWGMVDSQLAEECYFELQATGSSAVCRSA